MHHGLFSSLQDASWATCVCLWRGASQRLASARAALAQVAQARVRALFALAQACASGDSSQPWPPCSAACRACGGARTWRPCWSSPSASGRAQGGGKKTRGEAEQGRGCELLVCPQAANARSRASQAAVNAAQTLYHPARQQAQRWHAPNRTPHLPIPGATTERRSGPESTSEPACAPGVSAHREVVVLVPHRLDVLAHRRRNLRVEGVVQPREEVVLDLRATHGPRQVSRRTRGTDTGRACEHTSQRVRDAGWSEMARAAQRGTRRARHM
jgi:hypothetical protein